VILWDDEDITKPINGGSNQVSLEPHVIGLGYVKIILNHIGVHYQFPGKNRFVILIAVIEYNKGL
jgi:hypothetical protein